MELIVVIAITGIIITVAYPVYSDLIIESRRQDAIIGIQAIQIEVQEYFDVNAALPLDATFMSTTNSPKGYYTLDYSLDGSNNYLINAVPVAGTTQVNDTNCQEITLSSRVDFIFPKNCH